MGSAGGLEPAKNADGTFNNNGNSWFRRIMLGVLTSGTSEIKTGAGEYGDETVADSIFPKTINNLGLDEREINRQRADRAKRDGADSYSTPAPDLTDELIRKRASAGSLLAGSSGRRGTMGARSLLGG